MSAKCEVCGRFLSYLDEHVAYTPYGGYEDVDPPDERVSHRACFAKDHPNWETMGKPAWAWIGPTLHTPENVCLT